MRNLKSKTKEQTEQNRQSHRYREQTGGCQKGGRCGEERNR